MFLQLFLRLKLCAAETNRWSIRWFFADVFRVLFTTVELLCAFDAHELWWGFLDLTLNWWFNFLWNFLRGRFLYDNDLRLHLWWRWSLFQNCGMLFLNLDLFCLSLALNAGGIGWRHHALNFSEFDVCVLLFDIFDDAYRSLSEQGIFRRRWWGWESRWNFADCQCWCLGRWSVLFNSRSWRMLSFLELYLLKVNSTDWISHGRYAWVSNDACSILYPQNLLCIFDVFNAEHEILDGLIAIDADVGGQMRFVSVELKIQKKLW